MIEGNVSLDELMSRLITAQETYQSQLSLEIKEDDERAARDAVKREQDLAFEMSLVVSFPVFFNEQIVKTQFEFNSSTTTFKTNISYIH